jgi:hypothetical protein
MTTRCHNPEDPDFTLKMEATWSSETSVGVTIQTTATWIFIAVKTSNLAWLHVQRKEDYTISKKIVRFKPKTEV